MSLLMAISAQRAFRVPTDALISVGNTTPQAVYIRFNSNGTGESTLGSFNWFSVVPVLGAGDNLEIKASFVGSPPGGIFAGTVDAWLALTTAREWDLALGAVGSVTCDVLFEMRKVGETALVASGVVSFLVEVLS